MFEIIISLAVLGLCILVIKLIMSKDDGESYSFRRNINMDERIKKLEADIRYIADQPQRYYSVGSAFYDPDKYEEELHKNDVPITDVVKAIVKHLGMEILKSPETTTKTPMEVKVVEKPKVVMGVTGVVTMPDGSGIPMPKPKRKYTKRKPAAKTGGKKNA